MRVLLDTHVWIWTQKQSERPGPRTKRLLIGAEHENAVCPISTLEISRLVAAAEIRLSMPLAEWVVDHRDPADRILVAAARRNGLTLVTADDRMLSYPHVRTQDARR